jgi:hypothetical protein
VSRRRRSPLECIAGRYAAGAPGECWLWQGAQTWKGYGSAYWNGQSGHAHRVAYLALVGPIPDGMTVHHTCGTRLCVNPGHLQLLDRATHGRLHSPATAERCARGHEVSDANTYHQERKNGSVQRVCRVCDRERTRARYHAARSGA